MAVQVKSRFSDEAGSKLLSEKGTFSTDVRQQTFSPRDNLYMLFVVADAVRAEVGPVWLVPSHDFARLASKTGNGKLRITANAKDGSADKWSEFRLEREQLAPAILTVIDRL